MCFFRKLRKLRASFEEHKAPVSLLAAGGPGGEWLASADLAGAVNIFSLDGLFHHASVPVGRGVATALGFDSSGKHLVVATTAHVVTLFDIESQSLHADIPPFDIPKRHLAVHARVCGIAAFPEAPEKLLLWGHNYLLAVNVKAKKVAKSESAAEPYTWRLWAGIRHLLQSQAAEFRRWRLEDVGGAVSIFEVMYWLFSASRSLGASRQILPKFGSESVEAGWPSRCCCSAGYQ